MLGVGLRQTWGDFGHIVCCYWDIPDGVLGRRRKGKRRWYYFFYDVGGGSVGSVGEVELLHLEMGHWGGGDRTEKDGWMG